MNSDIWLIIGCALILLCALFIFAYIALVVKRQYEDMHKRVELLDNLFKAVNGSIDSFHDTAEGCFLREGDLINHVQEVLDLNDEIIRDNHKLSAELSALAAEIRGKEYDSGQRGSDEAGSSDLHAAS